MFRALPPVVKNLLIINVLVFLVDMAMGLDSTMMVDFLGLHHWKSELFRPHQLITYMFMHAKGTIFHIFFNMFALWMFGRHLEVKFGSKRFLIFYFACGIGAALISLSIDTFRLNHMHDLIASLSQTHDPQFFATFINTYIPDGSSGLGIFNSSQITVQGKPIIEIFRSILAELQDNPNNQQAFQASINYCQQWYDLQVNKPMIGASGSVYGVLVGFGVIFPNVMLMLLFPPIPIKAKYMVLIMIAIELYTGLQSDPSDNVGHFAHLGGAVVAYILIRIWGYNKFYDNL